MGCNKSKPEPPKTKKQPQRPDHSETYPHLNYMTGEVTWKAYDKYYELNRCNAQRNIKHEVTWRPSKSEWQ